MSNLQIYVQYKQLFCSTGSRFSGCSRMSLDEGVKDINTTAKTLEEIASNVPEKARISVGLKNCETELTYETEVQRPTDLMGPKKLLGYFLDLPKEHKPVAIHVVVGSQENLYDIESFLNQHGKTMQFSKSKNPPTLKVPLLLRPFVYIGVMMQSATGYGTLVRDLK